MADLPFNYSVVIPAYNAVRTIGETLASVLAQTHAPHEIIVVDDGSTDDTVALVTGFAGPIRVLKQANAGPGAATTRGMQAATASVLAVVDADDVWLPTKMALQMACLAADPDLQLVSCRQRQFRHGTPDDGTGEERAGMNRSNIVVRLSAALATGPMIDPPGHRGDVIDWLARFRGAGHRAMELDEVLVLRRILPGSLSYGRNADADRGYLFVARQAMLRRRHAEAQKAASAAADFGEPIV